MISHFLQNRVDGKVHVFCYTGEVMVTDVLQERQYESLGNVMPGNIGPVTHVEGILLLTTYFYITKDQVTDFMAAVLCDSCGIIQQNNIACHIAQVVQECL